MLGLFMLGLFSWRHCQLLADEVPSECLKALNHQLYSGGRTPDPQFSRHLRRQELGMSPLPCWQNGVYLTSGSNCWCIQKVLVIPNLCHGLL